ncbi:hypothetical protein [Candidatus Thiodiazotropha sp. CDECU1]|uniref:hypothetical protein n=1 Tax=Candidatus Thiodiazotropha sp. CDECU1 TaxID=3065865 RepID=UPI00292D9BC5|nr:hypothetical protein [Candidatus Thiodiazotropha sp. CDECU1]
MNQNISATLLFNLVNEKYNVIKSQLPSLLKTLSENNHKAKLIESSTLHESAMDLANILATQDRPIWLNEIIVRTEEFTSKHKDNDSIVSGSSWALLQALMEIYKPALNHNWNFSTQEGKHHYNFDSIYQKYREESDLETLFNTLINTLETMVSSGEIDSITAINSLKELIDILEQNKSSSYFSTMASWEFVKSFTCNLIWEQLDSIPGIKPIKKAFEKTMADTDIELKELHKKIADEMKSKYKVTIQNTLTYKNNKLLENDPEQSNSN